MLFDQNRVDAIIHNWKNQVFSNETIQGVPQRHSTCLKPPIGGFRNLASSAHTGHSKSQYYEAKELRKCLIEKMKILSRLDCNQITLSCPLPRGGGGGALGYLGGCIRSLSKFKNTPKALISGQKSTLILIKRWFFPLNKHPFFYQNTDIGWTGTRILT